MGIFVSQKGGFAKTEKLLKRAMGKDYMSVLDKYGRMGVDALAAATPKDTGLTSQSWTYRIEEDRQGCSIIWDNTNVVNGEKIAILLQYGHGTKQGGYVRGRNYINPALRPIFDGLAESAWREVTRS